MRSAARSECGITKVERNKSCEFSGSNAIFDMGLLAAQNGTAKRVAGENGTTFEVTITEEIEWVTGTDVELAHVPVGTAGSEIPFIYELKGDGTYGKKYTAGSTAGAGVYKVTANTKKITPPTDVTTRSKALVIYTYNADGSTGNGAVQVVGNAVDFPKAGRGLLEVLGCDLCDISTKYYAYLEFPQAKLLSQFDINLTTDGNHPFTIRCMQDYCDNEKKLFSLTVPEAQ